MKNNFKKAGVNFFYWWNNERKKLKIKITASQGFDVWWKKHACHHCFNDNTTVGDGGRWCDDCGKLTKH